MIWSTIIPAASEEFYSGFAAVSNRLVTVPPRPLDPARLGLEVPGFIIKLYTGGAIPLLA